MIRVCSPGLSEVPVLQVRRLEMLVESLQDSVQAERQRRQVRLAPHA